MLEILLMTFPPDSFPPNFIPLLGLEPQSPGYKSSALTYCTNDTPRYTFPANIWILLFSTDKSGCYQVGVQQNSARARDVLSLHCCRLGHSTQRCQRWRSRTETYHRWHRLEQRSTGGTPVYDLPRSEIQRTGKTKAGRQHSDENENPALPVQM